MTTDSRRSSYPEAVAEAHALWRALKRLLGHHALDGSIDSSGTSMGVTNAELKVHSLVGSEESPESWLLFHAPTHVLLYVNAYRRELRDILCSAVLAEDSAEFVRGLIDRAKAEGYTKDGRSLAEEAAEPL